MQHFHFGLAQRSRGASLATGWSYQRSVVPECVARVYLFDEEGA